MSDTSDATDRVRLVLSDANVLYSRVLRDYLLYAADQEIIAVAWSAGILAEVTEHLTENLPAFDAAAGKRLVSAMNAAFPFAEVDPGEEDFGALAGLTLPDEDDRHVLAAAVASEATVICTWNTQDFPSRVVDVFGFEVLTPDELLGGLIVEYESQMMVAHRVAVASLNGATDASTVAALRRAGAPLTADLMEGLLEV